MTQQPNRLATDTPHALSGSEIDRAKPLSFRLGSRLISGFTGDTVLSALLAAGIDTLGAHCGHPVGLSERLAPSIIASGAHTPEQSLPMARTPATDGAHWHLAGNHTPHGALVKLKSLIGRHPETLAFDLDDRRSMPKSWLDVPLERGADSDLVVIGGGVAGMSAAVAAAKHGSTVTLIERQAVLGGSAELFGALDGDETPAESISRLRGLIADLPNIAVLLRTEAISAGAGRVVAHQVAMAEGTPVGRLLALGAPRIILATGVIGRLPVFAGNRLPGVIGALESFARATRYGIWAGRSAIFATVVSAPYRLAMQASDAGIAIARIADNRVDPQSRFIEFAKAYGMTMASNDMPARVTPNGKGARLSVTMALSLDDYYREHEPMAADQLIVCGGWQPNLSLWHGAGGQSQWHAAQNRLEAQSGPENLILAGAAAGWVSKHACLHSGSDAANLLFGRKQKPVTERNVDPIYETPDGITPIAADPKPTDAPSYLDGGESLIYRAAPQRARWPLAQKLPHWSLADQSQAFGLGDVVAGAQLGLIAADRVGITARERSVGSVDLGQLVPPERPSSAHAPPPLVPRYVHGRFGAQPRLWIIVALEARTLEAGALIFQNSDQTDARDAIGVILRSDGDVVALIGDDALTAGAGLTVRAADRPVAIRLTAPHPSDSSIAAFGTATSPA